jgi:HdeA/HdeB family
MMMKPVPTMHAIRSCATAAFLVASSPVMAQTTDLARVTCANFLTLSASDQAQLALWLAGYYAGSAQRPVIEPARTAAAPAALAELCTKTPQIPLISAETRSLFVLPPNQ